MDEFAQTGAQQDDLFDDIQYAPGGGEEVEPMQTRAGDDLFGDEIEAAAEPVVERQQAPAPNPAPIVAQRGGARGGRGRGGEGRGGRGRGGREQQQQRTKDHQQQVTAADKTAQPQTAASGQKQETAEPASATPTENAQPAAAAAESASTPASAPAPAPLSDSRYSTSDARPSNSARGDRRATGGLQKPKLSAAELEAKMQRMSLRSAELTERHARAEADRQSFDRREQVAKEVAKQRSKEERRDRQQMMGEREKNRLRKLKAVEGREWDMQKQEEDYDPRAAAAARGGSVRGAHGGVAGPRDASSSASGFGRDQEDYTDGGEYLYRENRGRGRGGRGGRGGRASFGGGDARQSAPPKHSDFPELPSAGAPSTGSASAPAPTVFFPKKTKGEETRTSEAGSQQQDNQTSSEVKMTAPIDLPAPDAMAAAGGKRWADMVEG